MSLFQRFAPPLGSMQLIVWIATYIALPFFFAPTGLQFALFTLAFIIGIQPSIDRLSEEGHELKFALRQGSILGFFSWERKEFPVRLHIADKKFSNSLTTLAALLFTFLFVPGIIFIFYKATRIFLERFEERWETIGDKLTSTVDWARTIAPSYVPEGDTTAVFGGVIADTVGSLKHFVTEVSAEVATFFGHTVTVWFEIIVAMILLGVLVKNWMEERDNLRWRITHGLGQDNEVAIRRTLRFGELYQDGLSILIIGYLKVGLTLSLYYFCALAIFPFNLDFTFTLVTATVFGFATAIPKIGGIGIKILSPLVVMTLFPEGFGWYGFEIISFGLIIDLMVKVAIVFCIAFFGGYLESYDYTPEIIGKKLGITKMEMVMTILIWAIGAHFMGMIYGILLMLLIPTFTKLYCEEMNIIKGKDPEDELPLFKHKA